MQIPRAGRFAPVPRMPLACVFLILAQALSPSRVRGQTPPDLPPPGKALLEIRLVDESVLIGRVAAVDQDQVVLTTAAGVRIEIDRAQIRELRPAHGRIAGSEFWREDPSGRRLLFTATGRSLGRGESYVSIYVVVMPFASVGLTDSIHDRCRGTRPRRGNRARLRRAEAPGVLRRPGVQAALGTLAVVSDDDLVGIACGVATVGNADRTLTTGVGVFYTGDDVENEPAAM